MSGIYDNIDMNDIKNELPTNVYSTFSRPN